MSTPRAAPGTSSALACAFVGLLDVDDRTGHNAAYSPAGTQFQECLLSALPGTGLDVTRVFALRPVESFPKQPKLIYRARHVSLKGSIPATLIGFINAGALKTVTGGITLFPRLVTWAWRERGRRRVILLYNLYSPPGGVSVIAARLTRCRVVAIVADLQIPGEGLLPDTPLRRLDFWLQRMAIRHFDGLVVLTRRMAQDFAPSVPWMQMEGALPDRLLGELPSQMQHSRDGDTFIIMYSGGLSELKGVDRLLSAFSQLDGTEYRLWITGVGPLADLIRSAALQNDRIKYWGFTAESELTSLYQSADVLVNPHSIRHASAKYLFPSKLIEYLGTGTTVISTCSTPEVVEEYSESLFVSRDDSPDALAEAIRAVARMSREQRAEFGRRARQFVRDRKSWRAQARRIAHFIRHDIENR